MPAPRKLASVSALAAAALASALTPPVALGVVGEPTAPAPPGEPATPTAPPIQSPPPTPTPTARTRVTSLPPGAIHDGTARLRVRLSGIVYPGSPAPLLTPHVAGAWRIRGDAEYFTPASTLAPCSTYRLTVWAQTTANGQQPLGRRRTLTLRVACPSSRALQQSLARLGYLPYELHSRHGENARSEPEGRALAARYAYHPPAGPLVASVPRAPGLRYGALDPTTRGALMVFQTARGLTPTGVADARTWASLLAALTRNSRDPRPYTFVTVTRRIPETLWVHRGRHVVLRTPVNTGVPGAVTADGTFPIFSRFASTTMTGTNPDGSHYSDPGVPWVNYFNGGDAVHGFPRPSYGTPQSNGCVELPIATAERVYRLLSIGDLVIVSG